jgi:alpha-galactosidase
LNLNEKTIDIAIECEGAQISKIRSPRDAGHNDQLLGCWMLADPSNSFLPELSSVTKLWMKLMRQNERTPRGDTQDEFAAKLAPLRGYTSWYHRYNNISETTLTEDLAGINSTHDYGVFQVDDGYQAAVGDWLKMSPGFPRGLQSIFSSAKEKGLERGIWCAPFIALEHSNIVKLHPEWVLKDRTGQPVVCGNHPLWGGLFFALDTENQEFRHHLSEVLRTYFQEWGCSFLKADFLYASARIPSGSLTRAQRASRAHQFLYDECRKHGAKLLSCGATLSSAYGRCDYSRVGPDVGETWENNEMGATSSREKVSTRATLVNTVTRALLDGVCFGNDPDVVILRDNNQQLSREQRSLLATLNSRLGRLVFCSDPLQEFSDWHNAQLSAVQAHMNDRKTMSLAAICGRSGTAGTSYQVIFRGNSNTEGLQLRVNLNDVIVEGIPPQSSDARNIKQL